MIRRSSALWKPVFRRVGSPFPEAARCGDVQIDATWQADKTLRRKEHEPGIKPAVITAVLRSTFEAGRSSTGPENESG